VVCLSGVSVERSALALSYSAGTARPAFDEATETSQDYVRNVLLHQGVSTLRRSQQSLGCREGDEGWYDIRTILPDDFDLQ
jgi:hypothetical protein